MIIENKYRSRACGEVSESDIGKVIRVAGWVENIRDHGGIQFVDLRDQYGIVQVVIPEDSMLDGVRKETVITVEGEVTLRDAETVNPKISTGTVELRAASLSILGKVLENLPFEINASTDTKEEVRLKYRYLDLRRGPMQQALMARHRIVKIARDYFDKNGFVEIETPVLIKSTPEGARDYLVPSRVHPGEFYALPQSPQLYKQLLMLSGYDRYMQVARCFRDEDLRADRQPEFTQIDIEMSFVDEEDVMTMNEGFIKKVFHEVLGVEVQTPFRRMPYNEAMSRYGVDKPDTRFGLELCDLTDLVKNTEFKVFAGATAEGYSVRGINVKGAAATLTRKEIDKLTDFVKTYRAKGLAFTRFTADGVSSSFEKFLSEDEVKAIHERMGAEDGDVLLIVADKNKVVFDSLGALRNHLAKMLHLYEEGTFDFLWVTDFPLFEYDEDENRWVAMHHPFTSPKLTDVDKLLTDPGHTYARAYDIVLNGVELGGGSIRISDPDIQQKMFEAIGLTDEQAAERFGFLLNAFKYGVPPHGGMAYGLDRLVMLMLGKDSIKEVIAFPKVQNASDLMTDCPSSVDQKDLDVLHIQIQDEK